MKSHKFLKTIPLCDFRQSKKLNKNNIFLIKFPNCNKLTVLIVQQSL